jgi:hypothetical protein
MQSSAWGSLLRHIPAEQQNRFMLVTDGGAEIAVQSFLLIEREFAAIKGRLSGTQDIGRVFFVPYAKIDYFGFQQEVKESEFNEMFATLTIPDEAGISKSNSNGCAPSPEELALAQDQLARSGATSRSGIIRSEVLERFRSRPANPPGS